MDEKEFETLLEMCTACAAEIEDGGLEMLMGNLAKIHEYSGELLAMLSQDMEIEDWIKDKVSKSAQSIGDVKHYVEYKKSAYASHAHAVEMHGGDVYMGQKMSVSGPLHGAGCPCPQCQGPESVDPMPRAEGQRMPVMAQEPVMTPQSSMEGESECPMAREEDDMLMVEPEGVEISVLDVMGGGSEEEEMDECGPLAEAATMPGDIFYVDEDLMAKSRIIGAYEYESPGFYFREESSGNLYGPYGSRGEATDAWVAMSGGAQLGV